MSGVSSREAVATTAERSQSCRTAPGSAWMSEWRAAIGAGTARRTRLPRGRRQMCCVHATRVATRREATTKREADGGGRASHAVRRGSAQSLAPSHVGTASMALRPDGTRRTTNGTHARYLELNPPWRTYREHEQREPGAGFARLGRVCYPSAKVSSPSRFSGGLRAEKNAPVVVEDQRMVPRSRPPGSRPGLSRGHRSSTNYQQQHAMPCRCRRSSRRAVGARGHGVAE